MFRLGSHKPNTSLQPARVIKTDENTFGADLELSIEKSSDTIFCLLNNSQALISPNPPADTTKDPFVDSAER